MFLSLHLTHWQCLHDDAMVTSPRTGRAGLFVLLGAFTLLAVLAPVLGAAEPISVASPDGKLQVSLAEDTAGQLRFEFTADGQQLIGPSPVGFESGRLKNCTRRSVDSAWKPIWGKRAVVPERFNEAVIDCTTFRLIARAYDDGIAFRYDGLPAKDRESTQYHFTGDFTAWYTNQEYHNLGPEKLSECDGRRRPVATIKAGERAYLALHEADVRSGDPFELTGSKGSTVLSIATKPTEAWRVVLFGRSPGVLVDSHLIELLNPPPPADADFSWVKPGVCVWDWRINGAKVDGFTYRMSLPSWKRMVDLAAENRFPHLVLDANWYGPEFGKDSHPTKGDKVDQVREIIAYGKTKGVGVWLYLNDVGGRNFPIEETLKQYASWGASGLKYGFMRSPPAEKNLWTRKITELCAQYQLLCNFHDGPVHPYGQMRTFPNAVTREFCHAQHDAHRVFQPKTFVTAVFVNMVSGPIDMNNGLADLMQKGRVDNGMPVPSTLAGEMARTLIVFSGVTIIPDIPENYRKHPELLQYLKAQQQPWRESVTLSGEIGEHIVMARQAADGNWLIGAATDENARTLNVALTFLGVGNYEALVLEDGLDASYLTHVESYRTRTQKVTASDHITITLAPGGGGCVLIRPKR